MLRLLRLLAILPLALAASPASADVLPGPRPEPPAATFGRAPDHLPEGAVVPFASPESEKRLDRATAKVDFFHLANHFESQQNLGYCGPTSATILRAVAAYRGRWVMT